MSSAADGIACPVELLNSDFAVANVRVRYLLPSQELALGVVYQFSLVALP